MYLGEFMVKILILKISLSKTSNYLQIEIIFLLIFVSYFSS